MKILVTGGGGFIGSHLVDSLIERGHKVVVYDILEPQVHPVKPPPYLNKDAEYIFADIRDKVKLRKALMGIEVIFHLASQVGVGQSMYKIEKYVSHNSLGTAALLDLIVNTKNKVKKIVVASSMSVYGEGAYKCNNCGVFYPLAREEKQLKRGHWELNCPACRRKMNSIPTPEDKPLFPISIYATTKRSQEEMCLEVGRAFKIPVVALRYFNVYGPRQSLSNPYTGVTAIFLVRVKNNRPPLIFEDGSQSRDFIYVSDIVEANILAMEREEGNYDVFNVGTGKPHTILYMAESIISLYKKEIKPKILNKLRTGDVRHCYADITKISCKLGFKPKVSFKEGLEKLKEWSETTEAKDFTRVAHLELKKRGIV